MLIAVERSKRVYMKIKWLVISIAAAAFLLFVSSVWGQTIPSAGSPPMFTVTVMGAHLYARQDKESEIVANLEKEEQLIPVAYATGTASWYMVKTQKGTIGWVQSVDVRANDRFLEETLTERDSEIRPQSR